ncbi:MAG: hypothetical protein L0I79_05560, partial [Atopostipes sp.]|nr:hypothetical protein [Atopostipes sp.]
MIGMVMGILVNSIMSSNEEEIRQEQKIVEDRMRESITCLSKMLENQEDTHYVEAQCKRMDLLKVDELLDRLLKKAYEDAENKLLTETQYQISYLEMRKHQLSILEDLAKGIRGINHQLPHALKIASYMNKMSAEFTESNNVESLLKELDNLFQFFRQESLPETREEFENRAILFHLLRDLDQFLKVKKRFIREY